MPPFAYKIVDLTHDLSSETPTWDGGCGFEHNLYYDYDATAEYKFRIHKIRMNEGIGTHMDAPAHFIPGGFTIDQLPLADLVSPCVVIDISATANERSRVSVQDIKDFEDGHGLIQRGSFAMIRTGWERFWTTPERYRNNGCFPSISSEAAAFLLERGISGIGLDTLSPDTGENGFPVHQLILGAGKYIVENAANLTEFPSQGGFVMTAPLKIKDGTEAPIRLMGFVDLK